MGRTLRPRKNAAVAAEAPKKQEIGVEMGKKREREEEIEAVKEEKSEVTEVKRSPMESAGSSLTEYEMLRAMRVARNAAVLAELGVKDEMAELARNASFLTKRRIASHKGLQRPDRKRAKDSNQPVVIRRSLRSQGMSPSGESIASLKGDDPDAPDFETRICGDVPMRSSNASEDGDVRLLARLREMRDLPVSKISGEGECKSTAGDLQSGGDVADVHSLRLEDKDVAKLATQRIFCVAFLPTANRVVAAVGDKTGCVSLWDADVEPQSDAADEDQSYDGVHVFRPHNKPVSALEIHSNDLTKVYSCSFDGSVRVTDVDRGVFAEVHVDASSDFSAMGLSLCGHVAYVGDGDGDLSILDLRAKRGVSEHALHSKKINSVQVNPQREHLLLTSSTDNTAKLWDVRRWDATSASRHISSPVTPGSRHVSVPASSVSPSPLAVLSHSRGVNSAYFSPDGARIGSTSYDDCVRVWDNVLSWSDDALASAGHVHMASPTIIPHNNQTGRWISSFRAVWGWDCCHLFIGNMRKKDLDVVSFEHPRQTFTFESESLTTIPARLGVHPYLPVVGGGAGTKLYIWRAS